MDGEAEGAVACAHAAIASRTGNARANLLFIGRPSHIGGMLSP